MRGRWGGKRGSFKFFIRKFYDKVNLSSLKTVTAKEDYLDDTKKVEDIQYTDYGGIHDLEATVQFSKKPAAVSLTYVSISAQSTGRTPGTFTTTDTYATGLSSNSQTGYYNVTLSPGSYRFTVKGARGGNATYNTPDRYGSGAAIIATATLAESTTFIMLAGQIAGEGPNDDTSDSQGAGGGGGTFIAIGSSHTTATPFLIAGGGGGDANYRNANAYNTDWHHASLTENGKNGGGSVAGSVAYQYHQGTAGNGLTYTNGSNYTPLGSTGGSVLHRFASWHGGGFFTSGGGTSARTGGSAGAGFRQGGVGGLNQGGAGTGGGFGGGGGGGNGCGYGGGAGGYTGGMSGGYANGCGGQGGGGGSYSDSSLTIESSTADHVGNGYILIESI